MAMAWLQGEGVKDERISLGSIGVDHCSYGDEERNVFHPSRRLAPPTL